MRTLRTPASYAVILFLSVLLALAGTAQGQTALDETESTGEPQAGLQAAPPPEPFVRLFNNRLSVEAEEARFGEVIGMVAEEAGFELMISPDIAEKTLSTSFRDLRLQKGIQRLLALISHRNYFIYYGKDDSIKKIEIFGSVEAKPVLRKKPGWTPPVGPSPPSATYEAEPSMPQKPPAGPRQRPDVQSPEEPVATGDEMPDDAADVPAPPPPRTEYLNDSGVPYIVPTQEPGYIPPPKKRK